MACSLIKVSQIDADIITAQELSATSGASLVGIDSSGLTEISGASVQALLESIDDVFAARTIAYTAQGQIVYRGASAPALLTIGSNGDVLTVSGGLPSWQAPASGFAPDQIDPVEVGNLPLYQNDQGDIEWRGFSHGLHWETHFLHPGGSNQHHGILFLQAGIGPNSLSVPGVPDGVHRLSPGMNNGDSVGLQMATDGSSQHDSSKPFVAEAWITAGPLGMPAFWKFWFGLVDTAFPTTPLNAIMFYGDNAVNGGNWVTYTIASGTPTSTNTSDAVDQMGTMVKLKITHDGTDVLFFIDDSQVASHSTNIPSASLMFFFGVQSGADFQMLSADIDFAGFRAVSENL